MKRLTFVASMVFLALIFSTSSPLFAQNTTGEIDGIVVDSAGAAIGRATVIIVNQGTKETVRTVKAGKTGEYAVPLLNVGTYKVSATADGFQETTINNVELHVGDQLTISPVMKPGASDVTVEVDASQVAPDLETATMGSVVNSTEISELALNTRNFEQMVLLQPGVAYDGADTVYPGQVDANGNVQTASIEVNGLRPTQLSWSLDGADTLNQETSANTAIWPNVETIQQMKTLRNSYGAQYGGGGSAQIITVTKSGASTFHGDMFYFFRNQYLNANAFFNKIASPIVPRPPLQQGIFGYTVGGPVFIPGIYPRDRSKTFFFFSQEFRRLHLYPTDRVGDMPDAWNQKGWFQDLTPGTAKPCPTNTTLSATPPDSGHPCQLNTAIDAAAQAYINDVMAPVLAANPINDPQAPNGLIEELPSTARSNSETVRLDHQWSSRIQSFVRYTLDPNQQNVPEGIGRSTGFPGVGNTKIYSFGEEITPHTTFMINGSTVLEVGYSYLSYAIKAHPYGLGMDVNSPNAAAAITLPFLDTLNRLPTLTITSGISWGVNGPKQYVNHTQQGFANFTKQFGMHTFYFGANYEHFYGTVNAGGNNAGTFDFSGVFLNAFPKFLMGAATSFTQASIDPVAHMHQSVMEGYFQDTWKATPHLTLNGGVRYTYTGQPYDTQNHLGGFSVPAFNPAHAPAFGKPGVSDGTMCLQGLTAGIPSCAGVAPNPSYDSNNGIIQGGTNSPYGRAVARQSWLDFAPRVGFAWDLYGDGKTALRGGFGIFYNHYPLSLSESAVYGNPRYVQNLTGNNVSFDDPAVNAQTTTLDISGTNPEWKTPYTESWSLDMQQTLAQNWMLDVAYVGNSTQHLQGEEDLNQPLVGEYLLWGIDVLAGNDAQINPIRPYPGYGAILYDSTRFFADYNGLQVQTVKRFSDHSTVSVSYTWSKAMANSTGASGSDPQNRYDLHAQWGPADFNHTDLFIAHWIYDLPFFRNSHSWKANVFGGWQLSGIYQGRTGTSRTADGNQRDPGGQGIMDAGSNAPQYPIQIANPNRKAPHTQNAWFDPVVADNYILAIPAGTVGNGRVGALLGPNYNNLTADIFKQFHFTDRLRMQFRLEVFNALNHVNFNGIQVGVRNTFGQVTSAYDNRQLQLGAKLYF
jgi:hypothetical protein